MEGNEAKVYQIWSEEVVEQYSEILVEEFEKWESASLEGIKERIKSATIIKRKKVKPYKKEKETWWTKEWQKEKSEFQAAERKFRAEKIEYEEFAMGRKKFGECKKKRKEEYAEEHVKTIEECKNKKELWKVTRKKREGVSKDISDEDWLKHFKEAYEGSAERIREERVQESKSQKVKSGKRSENSKIKRQWEQAR